MKFKEIAKNLSEIATLLELSGENIFKIKAHQNAANILGAQSDNESFLKEILAGKVKGLGAGIQQVILELQKTGESSLLNELRTSFSESFLELLKIKGLGAKKIKLLAQELNINSIAELEDACLKSDLLKVKGFAEKTQKNILENIAFYKKVKGYFHFKVAKEFAEELAEHFTSDQNAIKLEEVGALRRKDEILNQLEFVAALQDKTQLLKKLGTFKEIIDLDEKSNEICFCFKNNLKCRIHLASKNDFAKTQLLKTGSEKHLAKLDLARLENEAGAHSEEQLYHALSLCLIPPEYRLGESEIEEAHELFKAKANFSETIRATDIKGVVHAHSTYSDGRNTLREMANACIAKGYAYLGISDHSQSAFYAGGLKPDQIKRQHDEIAQLNQELAPFLILKGIESDILKDGSLDYSDNILESFDFVIASVHSHFELSENEMTERMIRAIKNPFTKILGHPTGRLLLKREGYRVHLQKILETAAEEGLVVEINANPARLDLDWRFHKLAQDMGVQLAICPDAHSAEQIDNIRYGVYAAQKGQVQKENCLTTWDLEKIKNYFK